MQPWWHYFCPFSIQLQISIIILEEIVRHSVLGQIDLSATESQALSYASHTNTGRRVRRTPAIWGEPAPDYSEAQIDGGETYLYALLFVDQKISDHYRRDHQKVKQEVLQMAHEANNYFYQIGLRLIVVDILETMRNDLSLYSFEEFRNRRIKQLPFHNFAVLVSYRYAGGLAFVGGMCSSKSVMMAGFYPHNPRAMGSIFFHEVSHLIGVPHTHPNETLNVPNCVCAQKAEQGSANNNQPFQPRQVPSVEANELVSNLSRTRRKSCLRIPGFDHECTLQLLANLVYRNRCLPKEVRSTRRSDDDAEDYSALGKLESDEELVSLPICGNGVKELGEECDCGLERYCRAWNCDPKTCTRPVPLYIIVLCTFLIVLALVAPLIGYVYLRGYYERSLSSNRFMKSMSSLTQRAKFISTTGSFFTVSSISKYKSAKTSNEKRSDQTPFSPLRKLLEIFRLLRRLLPAKKTPPTAHRNEKFFKLTPESKIKNDTLNPLTSIVIVHNPASPDSLRKPEFNQRYEYTPARTLERPKKPPPPPPSARLSKSLQRNTRPVGRSNTLTRPKLPPPPLPPAPKFLQHPVTAQEPETNPLPVTKAGYTNKLHSPSPPDEEDRYSISHKFADFDDDEDYESDFDENLGAMFK
ncbi:reprolysin (M12B) family zinc metalloprotease domain-containing protein [Ditylenchus destructor]|uniref:Reprolysin (M12B) family zinc metalloprotease domain-containing protein n=1 Tax=Ditylenchus destructor TaxID=166010 RepID=A0AAD4N991_9BILA|nr:reprolysin (M12B) family zinc metalloprotease domain-containing protein [Ditylenchus destructor]